MRYADEMPPADGRALDDFAAACRGGLETLATRPGSMLQGFPRGACGPASELLGRLLAERLDLPGHYVCGDGHPDLRPNQSHAWVEVDGFIIDITHDQFTGTGLQGWVFPADSPWHTRFADQKKRQRFAMPDGWPMYPHDAYIAMCTALDEGT